MKIIFVLILQFCIAGTLLGQVPVGDDTKIVNFVDLIGKNFDAVGLAQKTYSIAQNEEWRAERGWTVEAADGSFQMSLDTVKTIRTIWLFPVNGKFRQDGYTTETTRKDIRKKLGKPTSRGDNVKAFLTRDAVSWDRYDLPAVAMHFEYNEHDQKLHLITLMRLEDAP